MRTLPAKELGYVESLKACFARRSILKNDKFLIERLSQLLQWILRTLSDSPLPIFGYQSLDLITKSVREFETRHNISGNRLRNSFNENFLTCLRLFPPLNLFPNAILYIIKNFLSGSFANSRNAQIFSVPSDITTPSNLYCQTADHIFCWSWLLICLGLSFDQKSSSNDADPKKRLSSTKSLWFFWKILYLIIKNIEQQINVLYKHILFLTK